MPASPGFSPQVVVLDPERWSFQENAKGNRLKKYCIPIGRVDPGLDGVDGWFWKESDRKYPHEFWSEIRACGLGAEMGVPEFGLVREGILLGVLEKRRARLIERLS